MYEKIIKIITVTRQKLINVHMKIWLKLQVLKGNIHPLQCQVVSSRAGAQGDPCESSDSPLPTAAAPTCSVLRTQLLCRPWILSSVLWTQYLTWWPFPTWHPINCLWAASCGNHDAHFTCSSSLTDHSARSGGPGKLISSNICARSYLWLLLLHFY